MRSLTFEPLVPAAMWLTLLIVMGALLVIYALSRPVSVARVRWMAVIALMSLSGGLVLAILLNPTWAQEIPPPSGKPMLTVLVDSSASMATSDEPRERTRFAAAAEFAGAAERSLGSLFDVRMRRFDAGVSPARGEELVRLTPLGSATDIAGAIQSSLEDDRPAGQAILLLSDGVDNGESGQQGLKEAVRLAHAAEAPIYTRTFGGRTGSRDLALRLESPQEQAFTGQSVPIVADVTQRGMAGGVSNVSLLIDGKLVDRRPVALGGNGPGVARFEVSQKKSGLYRYEVSLDTLPDELTTLNNRASFVLRVIDQPIRVLLLEGKPYWDGKFLVRTLLTDASIELDSVVRVAEGRFLRRTIAREPVSTSGPTSRPADVPDEIARTENRAILADATSLLASASEMRKYQIVVLGRDMENLLSDAAIDALRDWIAREGGALVCFRGAPMATITQRLAAILPVRWKPARESRFYLRLTDRGQDLRWLAADGDDGALTRLPTLAIAAKVEQTGPLSTVLASSMLPSAGEDSPAVIWQPYGMGRVVTIEGAGMWRWAFLPPQHQEHDRVYGELWRSVMRWLVSSAGLLPGQMMSLRADKVSFSTTETATAMLLVRDEALRSAAPEIELRGDGVSGVRRITPTPMDDESGRRSGFRVVLGKLPEGRYEARVAAASERDASARIALDVQGSLEERLNIEARPDVMAWIASETGGAVIEGDSPAGVEKQFREHLARSRPPRVERTTAWDRWWLMCGVLATWAAAWGIRRASGLT